MPWTCRVYESPDAARAAHGVIPVGAMWPAPWLLDPADDWIATYLSPKYRADWMAVRPPFVVKLPDGSEFCVDSRATDSEGNLKGDGWTVTGTPPLITVSPSINIVGRYHGLIQNGVITDDCEGRTFPSAPPAGGVPV